MCARETFAGFLDMDGRAKWRVTSVLPQAKRLAQAEFISAEHVKYPWGGAARGRETQR